jgi:hypothetical protein
MNSQKDRPVYVRPSIHKAIRKIAFLSELSMESIVNTILEDVVNDRESLNKILLQLEVDPRCLDEGM